MVGDITKSISQINAGLGDSLGLDLQQMFTALVGAKVVSPTISEAVEEGVRDASIPSLRSSERGSCSTRAVAVCDASARGEPLVRRVASDTGRNPSGSRPAALPSFPAIGVPPHCYTRFPHKSRT